MKKKTKISLEHSDQIVIGNRWTFNRMDSTLNWCVLESYIYIWNGLKSQLAIKNSQNGSAFKNHITMPLSETRQNKWLNNLFVYFPWIDPFKLRHFWFFSTYTNNIFDLGMKSDYFRTICSKLQLRITEHYLKCEYHILSIRIKLIRQNKV